MRQRTGFPTHYVTRSTSHACHPPVHQSRSGTCRAQACLLRWHPHPSQRSRRRSSATKHPPTFTPINSLPRRASPPTFPPTMTSCALRLTASSACTSRLHASPPRCPRQRAPSLPSVRTRLTSTPPTPSMLSSRAPLRPSSPRPPQSTCRSPCSAPTRSRLQGQRHTSHPSSS